MVKRLAFGGVGLLLAAVLAIVLVVSGGGPSIPPARSQPVSEVGGQGGWIKSVCAGDADETACRAALDARIVKANNILEERLGG